MPINLAQTALTAIKLGETALTAIYDGITRVYPNEVTVSIDGTNASTQSGSPGTSMNNLIYTVVPSSVSTQGWTSAQISAATLTGLPSGFTGTFSVSGGLGSQVGTWTINTTSGNFPMTDTSIAVASLTSTISETGWGTVNTVITATGSVGNSGGASRTQNINFTGFVGTTSSSSISSSTNVSYTALGIIINPTYQTGSASTATTSGPTLTFSWVNSGTGVYQKICNVSVVIPSTGPTASTGTCFGESVGQSPQTARSYTGGFGGPPWNVNPTSGIQCYYRLYYPSNTGIEDPRIRYWVNTDFTGSVNISSPQYFTQQSTVTSSSTYIFGQVNPNGSGNYTIDIDTNWGIAGLTYAQNATTRNAAPAYTSQSWGWN